MLHDTCTYSDTLTLSVDMHGEKPMISGKERPIPDQNMVTQSTLMGANCVMLTSLLSQGVGLS